MQKCYWCLCCYIIGILDCLWLVVFCFNNYIYVQVIDDVVQSIFCLVFIVDKELCIGFKVLVGSCDVFVVVGELVVKCVIVKGI